MLGIHSQVEFGQRLSWFLGLSLTGRDFSSDGAHMGMGQGETVGTPLRPVVVRN